MKTNIYIILFLLLHHSSTACSCIGKRTVSGEFEKSDAVFTGKILTKNNFLVRDSSLPTGYKMYRAEVKVLVLKVYKGHFVKDTINIITGVGGGDCGVDFIIGREYILYTNYVNKYFEAATSIIPFLYTDICTRTMINNKKERKELKKSCR